MNRAPDFVDRVKVSYPYVRASTNAGKRTKEEGRVEFMVVTATAGWLQRFEDAAKTGRKHEPRATDW